MTKKVATRSVLDCIEKYCIIKYGSEDETENKIQINEDWTKIEKLRHQRACLRHGNREIDLIDWDEVSKKVASKTAL